MKSGVDDVKKSFTGNRKSAMGATVIRSRLRRPGFATNVGKVRRVDEDSLIALDVRSAYLSQPRSRLLLMVADGMGGHSRGDVASRIAVQTVVGALLPILTSENDIPTTTYHRGIMAAVGLANQSILAYAQARPECEGMGTTLCLVVVDGENLHIANVGDSRVYMVNDQEICQVTRDHSHVQELVDSGEISAEEARHHPQKNVITRVVGYYGEVVPDIGCLTGEPGEMVLLCCDGLTNHVPDEEIQRVVAENHDPQRACDVLVALANKDGGTDNISVLLAPANYTLQGD